MKSFNKWYNKNKISFWVTITLFILALIVTSVIFIIQTNDSKEHNNLTQNGMEEIKAICEKGIENCEEKIIREPVFVPSDLLEGSCPYTFFSIKEKDYFLDKGSLQFWIKLERLKESFFENENIIFGNITMGVEGKINNAFRYQGLKNVESNKRYILEYLDNQGETFLELYITKNKIISFRIFDSSGKEFVLSYNNLEEMSDWTHIIVSWGDEINLFVNGIESKDKIILSEPNFKVPLSKYYFGASSKKTDCLNGLMDEVAIWGRTLEPSEVLRLYNNGEGLPYEEF